MCAIHMEMATHEVRQWMRMRRERWPCSIRWCYIRRAGGLLGGAAILFDRSKLFGVALLGLAASCTLLGFTYLSDGSQLGGTPALLWQLAGVGLILFGVACLVLGIALSYRPESTRRMLAWLKARDEVTNGMARQDISQSNNAVALRDSNVIVPAGEVRQVMSEPAGVEGPTAEVRVLQVGNGQITSIA
jgi:hypothetical protein